MVVLVASQVEASVCIWPTVRLKMQCEACQQGRGGGREGSMCQMACGTWRVHPEDVAHADASTAHIRQLAGLPKGAQARQGRRTDRMVGPKLEHQL